MKPGRYFLPGAAAAILLGALLGKPLYAGYRNYAGYCSTSGTRTPAAQKVDSAIAYFLGTYPSADNLDQVMLRSSHLGQAEAPPGNQPIPYRDIDHFKSLNPGCCELRATPSDPEFPPADLWDRIFGVKSSFVVIRYRLRYLSPTGDARERPATRTVAVTNCGESWSGI